MVLSTITGTLLFFFAIFQLGVQGICCRDTEVKIMYFYSVIDVIFDLAIGILPAIFIRKTKLDRRTKFGIASLLGLGCLACAAVIARIPFLHLMTEESFLYETTMVAVCFDVETGLGIMAGCFMVMRRAFFFTRPNDKENAKGYVSPHFVSQATISTL
ncbi:hypothetical protein BDV27DRAFT_145882 [Aspergillus caelatus]|uniref:Rhodopsin domain-containing protein n=1 Tax=Aspergillus caelatus TaxID=61420 RepID=A0A5N7A3H7_9EURO|nr:uncharacterized protein BDV27DRAFT_145882 [Aspergillus caelatus]KAE8363729.1 hypothetical protein BDV27DRAFT_145882 [Aspergillus caelatus]